MLIGPAEPDPLAPAVIGGALRAADGFPGIVADAVVPLESTAAGLRAAAYTALLGKPAAVALWIDDATEAADALESIRAAHVTVITIGVYPDAGRHAHVAIDWSGGATLLGERLVEVADSHRSYVLVHADGHDALASNIYASFSAAAGRQYSLTLLDERLAHGAAVPAAIEALLSRFHHAGLVVTLSRTAWLDPRAAVRLPAGTRFATLSAAPPLWPRLRSGEAAALVGPVAGDVGRIAMELLLQAAVRELRGDEVRYVPCELVTADSLDAFAARYIAAGDLDPRTLERRVPDGSRAP